MPSPASDPRRRASSRPRAPERRRRPASPAGVRSATAAAGAAPERDRGRLGGGVDDRGLAVAAMSRVHAGVRADRLAHRPQFLLRRGDPGGVLEPGRQAGRARIHRLAHHRLQATDLAHGERAQLEARHVQAQRAVRHERYDVHRRPGRRERGQVVLERARRPRVLPFAPAAERRHPRCLDGVRLDRRQAMAAVADGDGCDALQRARLRAAVDEQREVGVRVNVDDAGRDDQASDVDDFERSVGRHRADGADPAALDRDVRPPWRRAGAVDDGPAGEHERAHARGRAISRKRLQSARP